MNKLWSKVKKAMKEQRSWQTAQAQVHIDIRLVLWCATVVLQQLQPRKSDAQTGNILIYLISPEWRWKQTRRGIMLLLALGQIKCSSGLVVRYANLQVIPCLIRGQYGISFLGLNVHPWHISAEKGPSVTARWIFEFVHFSRNLHRVSNE